MSQFYAMPLVRLGDSVLWYPSGDKKLSPAVAIVTSVGPETVCVNIFDPNSHNMLLRDGVRHVSDPRCKDRERQECGIWEHTPQHEEIRLFMEKAKHVEKPVK